MRKPSHLFLALLALCGHWALAQDSMAAGPLLLSQALQYALGHSPSITAAKSTITSAEAQKLAAIAALLPSLSLTSAPEIFTPVAKSGSSVIGGVVVPSGHGFNANVASANVSLNLFAGDKNAAELRASLDSQQSANLAMTATLDTLFGQLLTDFAASSIDQVTMRDQARIVQLEQDLVVLTTLRLHGRVASEIDVIEAQQQLLQARLQLSEARQQLIGDLEKVYADIGLPEIAGQVALEDWIPVAPSAEPSRSSIVEDPAVASARAALVAAQEKVTVARADYYPTVSLIGQYNYLGIDPSSMARAWRDTHANNYSFGLQVTVPILPLYNVLAEVDSANSGVESAQGEYQGALVSAADRVTDAAEKLNDAREALDIAARSTDLAQRNVRLVQDRYAARQASRADVDNAQVLYVQASQALSTTQLNFRLAEWEQYRALEPKAFPTALLAAAARGSQ